MANDRKTICGEGLQNTELPGTEKELKCCISTVPELKLPAIKFQAIEFWERQMVLTSERYIGKSVLLQVVNGMKHFAD